MDVKGFIEAHLVEVIVVLIIIVLVVYTFISINNLFTVLDAAIDDSGGVKNIIIDAGREIKDVVDKINQ